MTSTTRTATSRPRRTVSALALTVVGSGAAALATAGLGVTTPAAQADPGDTLVAIGSSRLVQSEDLAALQLTLDRESVVLGQDADFSSCLGQGNPWTSVLA